MAMPAVARGSAHTAALAVLIVYEGLAVVTGVKLALMEEAMAPPPQYFLRAWGLVVLSFHQVLYLPALSVLFSAMHCGIVHFLGISTFHTKNKKFLVCLNTVQENHLHSM